MALVDMAQIMDVTALLQAAQSADAGARQHAEAGLKQLESQPESYLLSLGAHLGNETNPVDTRRLAGAWTPAMTLITEVIVATVSLPPRRSHS